MENAVTRIASAIDQLNKVAAGRFALHPGDALFAAGLSETQETGRRTASNKLWAGTYPFPTVKVGNKRVVLVRDLLAALGLTDTPPAPQPLPTPEKHSQTQVKRGRGRPRKVQPQPQAEGGV